MYLHVFNVKKQNAISKCGGGGERQSRNRHENAVSRVYILNIYFLTLQKKCLSKKI